MIVTSTTITATLHIACVQQNTMMVDDIAIISQYIYNIYIYYTYPHTHYTIKSIATMIALYYIIANS